MKRNHRLAALAAATSFALVAGSAAAAGRSDLHQVNVAQLNLQYQAAALRVGAAPSVKDRHAEMLAMNASSDLRQLALNTDKDGTRHYRYQQTYRGIPVFGESIVVSEKDGTVKNLFGRMVTGLESELSATAPRLSAGQALALGKQAGLTTRLGFMRIQDAKSEQMVYVDDAGTAHLAYVVSYFADTVKGGSPTRPFVIVDANSGAILKQWDGLAHALVGTGPGGNAKTGQYEWGSGGRYAYLDVVQSGSTCTMNSTNVKSVNLNGSTGTSTTAYSYTCPRNTYKAINGAYSPINDAHAFGTVITKMYPAYTGYNALSFQLVMRVHYGSNYENAFWNGSNMSFGDGATTFYPLVNADVSGHEVSHGFTEQHSNLTYSGQSGGMNEAFSDMGGEATEYYWKGTNDFNVGTEIFKSASGALRYMCTPKSDGRSIDNAANYTSGLDVHYSSGVYNKAFCTLAKTSGWNTPTAFKVFARANALYWTASSTFNQGACGVEQAATDLGLSKAAVTAAFTAVGVSCGSTGGGTGTTYSNTADYNIYDNATVDSPITVSGRSGYASATTSVSVNIVHTYIGDLKVDLVAPDGSLYNIHNRSGGSADNIVKTVTLNLSSELMNGTWKLRVNDNAAGDTGYINSWSITF